MSARRMGTRVAVLALLAAAPAVSAQQMGPMKGMSAMPGMRHDSTMMGMRHDSAMSRMMGMRHDSAMSRMMGMRHDSATMSQMAVIHELLASHDRITRSVTNLPDGIRATTESDDPATAQRIKTHVKDMSARVAARDDPGMMMESAAMRTLYAKGDKVRTVIDTSARGIVIVQTSSDAAVVAALQQHASEVTDLVREGMPAMHRAMMKQGGGMAPRSP